MRKQSRSTMALLVFALIITLMQPMANVSAKTKGVTDAQLTKVMKCYRNILATDPYKDLEGGGFTAKTFLLKDLDKDGVPELIINGEASQIFSYNLNSDRETFIFNSWVYNTLFYSEETKTVLYTNEWKGKKEWSFFKINNTQDKDGSDVMESLEEYYSYTDGKYEKGDTCKAKKGYYEGDYYSEKPKKTTKKAVEKAIDKLAPANVELKTTIKNTATSRKKYLGSLKQFKKFTS